MKILHTADWHLGKRLDHFSRLEEQVKVLEEIIKIADEESVDLVLIAGDLYDTFNPPVDAQDLFYKTLTRLSKNGTRPIIAIAGNHDAPSFIDAPNPLAKACGIILIGLPNAIVPCFELNNFAITQSDKGFIEIKLQQHNFPIRILHTAYANEQRLKENLGEDKDTELNKVLAQNWNTLAEKYCDNKGVNILMTHLYMNKKGAALLEEPEGEKPIKIGNADMVYSESIPTAIQYTALGHLHGCNNIGTEESPVVYASAPLCYSFSEAGRTKYVCIVDLEPDLQAQYKKIAIQGGRPLHRMTFDDVSEAVSWLEANPYCLVELTLVSDTFITTADRKLIFKSHDGIIHLIPKMKNDPLNADGPINDIDFSQDMPTLFFEYFKSRNGNQEPSEEIMNLFNEILNA